MGLYVVAYDVADDDRRERLSLMLTGYGPRVQMSVFEVEVSTKTGLRELKKRIREVVDRQEDQVRIYPIASQDVGAITIIGARMIEERADYWVVR
ncbi:MAG: CRISPR-associated endonuclease Cas2 [Candidatus Nanopelagicales bacterium]